MGGGFRFLVDYCKLLSFFRTLGLVFGISLFWDSVGQSFGVDLGDLILGHFQVGSYRYRSLIEGLYTL